MKKHLLTLWFICAFIGVSAQVNEQINIDLNKIMVEPNGEFVDIIYPGTQSMEEVGAPRLPVITQSFVIPVDAEVTEVKINAVSKQKIPRSFYIYPAQQPVPTSLNYIPQNFRQDGALYASATPFPSDKVKIVFDGFDHGYHIVTIAVYPFEYIPQSREVYACNISFSLTYSANVAQNGIKAKTMKQTERESQQIKNHIRSIVKNAKDVELFVPATKIIRMSKNVHPQQTGLRSTQAISVMDTIIPQYLIITNEALKPEFQRLANWKIKKGIPTVISTTEYILANYPGSDIPDKIRNYIIECCEKWNKTNLYVLLGGDYEIIPTKKYQSSDYDKDVVIDLYFATTDGDWIMKKGQRYDTLNYTVKSIQGRASVKTPVEANIFVNKVINYEKAKVDNKVYYNNVLVNDAFMIKSSYLYSQSKYSLQNMISYPAQMNLHYLFDDYNCADNTGRYKYYSTPSAWSTSGPCISGDQELNRQNVLLALNRPPGANSFHIIYAMDHGHVYSHGTSSIDKSESIFREDVANLVNGNHTQIFVSSSCETAQFDKDCFAESYMNNPNGGAVAYIGNADNGWTSETYQFKNFIDAINKKTTPYSIGYLFRQIQTLSSSGSYQGSNRKMLLLGDPTMEVWTDTPKEFNAGAVLSTSTVSGHTGVSVTINNLAGGDIATICIQKGEEAYMVDDNIDGNGTYVYDVTSHTSDSIHVTITAHNYVPKEIALADNGNKDKNLWVSVLNFDDVQAGSVIGNGDGQLDAGETIGLTIHLKNTGVNTASTVSATLSCNLPQYVTVINPVVQFGNIPSGSEKASGQKYLFKIDPNTPQLSKNDLNPLTFTLKTEDSSGNTFYEDFNIDVYTFALKQGNKQITFTTDGDSDIEPGETVRMKIDLFNAGKSTAKIAQAQLTSSYEYVQSISLATSAYPDIRFQETQSSTAEFEFKVTNGYRLYDNLFFTLTVTSTLGKVDVFEFNLPERPPKILVDNIIPTGYKDEIELKWTPTTISPISPIEGYNIYRSDADANGNDLNNYQKLNTFLVPNTYFKDYGLNEFSTYYYKIAAVSKNSGNESEHSVPVAVSTIVPLKYIYPVAIETDLGETIISPIIAYDVNNDGYKEIFTTTTNGDGIGKKRISTIVGFNYDGSEFFKRGNETTNNGFADLEGAVWGGLAIGDLYGTGENQIVSITREYDGGRGQNNYHTCHSLKDENPKDYNPDILWQKHYGGGVFSNQAPIIANVDNNSAGLKNIFASSEHGFLPWYKHNGDLFWEHNTGAGGWSYPSVAVADLNGNGYKDVIWATKERGVFIHHNDNSSLWFEDDAQLFYYNSQYPHCSSVVVADLNNDGQKDIIFNAYGDQGSCIHAVDGNTGVLLNGWGTTATKVKDLGNIVVGDLNGDGTLEVIALSKNNTEDKYYLRIWNNVGTPVLNKHIPDWDNVENAILNSTPIIADVDGDRLRDAEVVFTVKSKLEAIKMDGKPALGFPIQVSSDLEFKGTLSVADIDNDGKSEIIAATGNYMQPNRIHVWQTQGNPSRIEWGSARHDAQNTGEYHKICDPIIIKSNTTWWGDESLCGDIMIESGTLTLSSNYILQMESATSTIFVKNGASLVIDGATIDNANIKGVSGSSIVLKNNGRIQLRNWKEFTIMTGCSFDHQSGNIEK